jgi:penicillin-binding protein 1A
MKFERLSAPSIPLPDMVAFNRRVHVYVDAWFERRWFRWLAIAAAAGFALFAAVWLYFATGLPSSDTLLAYQPPLPTKVRSYDGDPVQTFARERRVNLSYDEVPPVVVHAFISAEDKTFFHHNGIDYTGLVGAVGDYAAKTVTGGGRARGGSTITQQVAKALLQDSSYNIGRKVREAILAFRLESVLTKQQILELYLNQIFLGRNAYGVQAAARAYFDKDIGDLTLPEAAYLAVLPKAPANYDPERATARALDRRNYVLREMYRNGYISEEQWKSAAATPLGTIRYGAGEHFLDMGGYYMEEVRRELLKKFGETAKDGPNSLYSGGLWVRSSVDTKLQEAMANALDEGLARFDGGRGWRDLGKSVDVTGDWAGQLDRTPVGTGFRDWRKAVVLSKDSGSAEIGFANGSKGTLQASAASMPKVGGGGSAFSNFRPGMIIVVKDNGGGSYELRSIPRVSGGMLAEEVHTGRVLAMQGGFDVIGSPYNRAVQAQRQPGSAFKPIVYVTGLENGMTPATIEVDAPFCIWQGAGLGNKCFTNFDHRYAGPHTMRWGLEQSRNLMTVRAASQIGMAKITDTARKLGVGDYPNYLSMALGAGDTTVARLVNAYSILANHGQSVTPTIIDYVQDRDGKVIYRSDNRCAVMQGCNAPDWNGQPMPRPPVRSKQVVDPMAAFQMVHVMEGVIMRGTAVVLRDLDRPMFGKTGTTNGPTNVWFVGGTPDIVAGVYVGYDQPRPLGRVQGASVAAPIWKQWAKVAFEGKPKIPFVAPAGIRWVRIDRATGKRVYGVFPTKEEPQSPVIWEAFQPQTEPRRSFRHHGSTEQDSEQSEQPQQQQRRSAPARAAQPQYQAPAPVTTYQAPQPAPLQNTTAAH